MIFTFFGFLGKQYQTLFLQLKCKLSSWFFFFKKKPDRISNFQPVSLFFFLLPSGICDLKICHSGHFMVLFGTKAAQIGNFGHLSSTFGHLPMSIWAHISGTYRGELFWQILFHKKNLFYQVELEKIYILVFKGTVTTKRF